MNVSAALVRAGVPGASPYWRGEHERFYLHPTARLLVECVGRGGDKSRDSVIMGTGEILACGDVVPPGERHYFTHVSENVSEAQKTLAVYSQYFQILGVPFRRAGDTLELEGLPLGVRVLACRIGAVSGYRCIGWTADECAKWSSDGVDPSAEVIASIKAMTVTHPDARGRMISSPLATLGYFYETFALGNTADQIVGQAPSWVANPSITEAATHKLERDPRRHEGEYGAEFREGTEESLWAVELIDRATRETSGDIAPRDCREPFAAMDPSLGKNAFTLVIAAKREVDGRTKSSIVLAREWRAPRGTLLRMDEMVERVADCVRPYTDVVYTDQYHGETLAAIADRLRVEVRIEVDKPTSDERLERHESLGIRLLDDEIELYRDPQYRADMISARRRIVSGSADRFSIFLPVTADGRHADYVPATVLALAKARSEAMPAWVGAMKAWKARENGEAPPVREAPRAANYFVDPATDRTFGQREKYVPPVVATTDYIRAIVTVVGNPPHYPRDYVATWVRAEHTRFTPNCTKEFREEVERQRSRGTL
jgi:hypothetical protein